jgi:hypothetical protein
MSRTIFPTAAALGARSALVLAATAVLAVAVPVAWPAPAATARPTAATASQLVAAPAAPAAPAGALSVTVTSHFVWTTTSSNTGLGSQLTIIDNGATNDQPGDLLFVTPNFSPGGVCPCVAEPGAIDVGYLTASGTGQWTIGREDLSAMPVGVSFNVLVVPKNEVGKSAFVHTAKRSNTGGNHTFLNSPLINGKPNALIQVTQNVTAANLNGNYNPHAVGVAYDPVNKRWAIFNEDNANMKVGVSFNVLIGSAPSNGGQAERLITTSSNQTENMTIFTNPETTGNPNNVTFVTQDYNPAGGDAGVFNNAETGLWYDGFEEAVINEGGASMPLNAAFNLLIFPS